MSKWKVYISSTFIDLKDFRAELINLFQNQLQNNFELSKIMERMFDDGTYTPIVKDCVEEVEGCDIYIIILGNKTGSSPPDENRTYTEIELETALVNDKRIFCLRLETFDQAEIDNKPKHQELLDKFKGRHIHAFKDSLTLKNELYEFLFPFSSQSPINKKNPYKGLASFDVEDGNYFHGRSSEIEACLKKMVITNGNYFVSVIGNSGTGKSSFVKAGLLFRLKNQKDLGFSDRIQVIVTPGNEPFTNLKYQLRLQGLTTEDLTKKTILTDGVVVFFDQFEEVITQCQSAVAQVEREHLFDFLDTLTSNKDLQSKVLVITTFRSDYASQLANFDFIKSYQEVVFLSSLDYKVHSDNWEQIMVEIITKPAQKNGVVIEKELVDQLINQIKDVEGALPILQFALQRIWTNETIEDRRISATEYSKLSEGKGISGIIEAHAEKVVNKITQKGKDKEKEAILKGIFINLVEVNENLNDVKKSITKDQLISILKAYPSEEVHSIFEILVGEKSRLLYTSQDYDKSINVGIIHEELIRRWERLKGWINERREAMGTKKRIALDLGAYQKGEDELYGRKQLKRARRWKIKNPDLVTDEINTFLAASYRNTSRRIIKISGITTLVLAVITAGIFEWLVPLIQLKDFYRRIDKDISLKKEIDAVGGLDSLIILNFDSDSQATLVDNLNHITNLEVLAFRNTSLPDLLLLEDLSNPNNIDTLFLVGNKDLVNTKGIEKLTTLTHLTVNNNNSLETLSGIENLTALNHLNVIGNNSLETLSGIENLNNLTNLEITANNNLGDLSEIENLTNLTHLAVRGNNSLGNLSGIENLTNLTHLEVSVNNSLETLSVIEKLTNLTHLEVFGANNLEILSGIENLITLTHLEVSSNISLKTLSGIEKLTNLTHLEVTDNDSLKTLSGIEKLTNLTHLEVFGNNSLETVSGIEKLTNLTHLTIFVNNSLETVSGIEKLTNLTHLTIFVNNSLETVSGIEKLTNLTHLEVSGNNSLKTVSGIEKLTNLTHLEVSGNNSLKTVSGIEKLTNLTHLEVSSNISLKTLSGIEYLTALTHLEVRDNNSLGNLSGIEKLTTLTHLEVSGNNSLKTVSGIEKLTTLTHLEVTDNDSLKTVSGIEKLTNLTHLEVTDNDSLKTLSGIEKLTNLTHFTVFDNNSLETLSVIEKLTNLTHLEVRDDNSLKILSGIEKLTNLTHLTINTEPEGVRYLSGNLGIVDLEILYKIENLKHLTLPHKINLDYEHFRRINPGVKIKLEYN